MSSLKRGAGSALPDRRVTARTHAAATRPPLGIDGRGWYRARRPAESRVHRVPAECRERALEKEDVVVARERMGSERRSSRRQLFDVVETEPHGDWPPAGPTRPSLEVRGDGEVVEVVRGALDTRAAPHDPPAPLEFVEGDVDAARGEAGQRAFEPFVRDQPSEVPDFAAGGSEQGAVRTSRLTKDCALGEREKRVAARREKALHPAPCLIDGQGRTEEGRQVAGEPRHGQRLREPHRTSLSLWESGVNHYEARHRPAP